MRPLISSSVTSHTGMKSVVPGWFAFHVLKDMRAGDVCGRSNRSSVIAIRRSLKVSTSLPRSSSSEISRMRSGCVPRILTT